MPLQLMHKNFETHRTYSHLPNQSRNRSWELLHLKHDNTRSVNELDDCRMLNIGSLMSKKHCNADIKVVSAEPDG